MVLTYLGTSYSASFFKPEMVRDGSNAETCACVVFRCLYLMALDGYRHGWADNFEVLLTEAPIVHAGAVLLVLDLLPSAPNSRKVVRTLDSCSTLLRYNIE